MFIKIRVRTDGHTDDKQAEKNEPKSLTLLNYIGRVKCRQFSSSVLIEINVIRK